MFISGSYSLNMHLFGLKFDKFDTNMHLFAISNTRLI